MSEFVIDLDDSDWIAVPPVFPYGQWADSAQWANATAMAAITDDLGKRADFAATALRLASLDVADVDFVLWYAPLDGTAMGVAYLTVLDATDCVSTLDEFARDMCLGAVATAHIRRTPSPVFGEIVQVSATVPRSVQAGGGCREGVSMAGPLEAAAPLKATGPLRTVCTLSANDESVFVLRAVDHDPVALELMSDPLIEVLQRVRFLTPAEEVDEGISWLLDAGASASAAHIDS